MKTILLEDDLVDYLNQHENLTGESPSAVIRRLMRQPRKEEPEPTAPEERRSPLRSLPKNQSPKNSSCPRSQDQSHLNLLLQKALLGEARVQHFAAKMRSRLFWGSWKNSMISNKKISIGFAECGGRKGSIFQKRSRRSKPLGAAPCQFKSLELLGGRLQTPLRTKRYPSSGRSSKRLECRSINKKNSWRGSP